MSENPWRMTGHAGYADSRGGSSDVMDYRFGAKASHRSATEHSDSNSRGQSQAMAYYHQQDPYSTLRPSEVKRGECSRSQAPSNTMENFPVIDRAYRNDLSRAFVRSSSSNSFQGLGATSKYETYHPLPHDKDISHRYSTSNGDIIAPDLEILASLAVKASRLEPFPDHEKRKAAKERRAKRRKAIDSRRRGVPCSPADTSHSVDPIEDKKIRARASVQKCREKQEKRMKVLREELVELQFEDQRYTGGIPELKSLYSDLKQVGDSKYRFEVEEIIAALDEIA